MQKITITSLVLTTTAGLQMDSLRAVGSVVKWTRSQSTRTESFRFEDDFWHKTRGINLDQKHHSFIRPDTLYLSLTTISARYNIHETKILHFLFSNKSPS